MDTFLDLLPGFALSFTTAALIVGLIYYPTNRSKQEYVFAFLSFNVIIYFVATLLRDMEMSIGFAFGLLAIFSTMSYRTMPIPVREMTYMFICTALPFINTLFTLTNMTLPALAIINLMILIMVYVLDTRVVIHYQAQRLVIYEKHELIKPENSAQMMEDLRQRTGLDIKGYEIIEIDFLRDLATVAVFYEPKVWKKVEERGRKTLNARIKEVMS
ncbi:MAG: DUF4956 domain-containing protein [Chloroflexota bacterium]|nr:DUF4956 domain-containing protein [Chloroflexota bacterium]